MRGYKFLVMQSNENNNVGFLSGLLGGSSSADINTNITHFKKNDFGGGHDNDRYWNSAEDLLVGFSRWYLRIGEKEAHLMGNRIYSATDTFRFFRIDTDLDDHNNQVDLANNDLASFEITEKEFISNIFNSWAFQQISSLFPDMYYDMNNRAPARPVTVIIVYNKEFNTWCWSSDYLNKEDYKGLEVRSMQVKVGLHYNQAVVYLSERSNCKYRFGGDDSYYKRKELERKVLEDTHVS